MKGSFYVFLLLLVFATMEGCTKKGGSNPKDAKKRQAALLKKMKKVINTLTKPLAFFTACGDTCVSNAECKKRSALCSTCEKRTNDSGFYCYPPYPTPNEWDYVAQKFNPQGLKMRRVIQEAKHAVESVEKMEQSQREVEYADEIEEPAPRRQKRPRRRPRRRRPRRRHNEPVYEDDDEYDFYTNYEELPDSDRVEMNVAETPGRDPNPVDVAAESVPQGQQNPGRVAEDVAADRVKLLEEPQSVPMILDNTATEEAVGESIRKAA